MRRIAIPLCAALAITAALSGCKSKESTSEVQAYGGSADMYALTGSEPVAPAEQTPAYEPYESYPQTTASEPIYTEEEAPVVSSSARYHTVGKKETLYSLARMYYNDHHRWKDIYEANKAAIGDPNKIYVGQRLVIP